MVSCSWPITRIIKGRPALCAKKHARINGWQYIVYKQPVLFSPRLKNKKESRWSFQSNRPRTYMDVYAQLISYTQQQRSLFTLAVFPRENYSHDNQTSAAELNYIEKDPKYSTKSSRKINCAACHTYTALYSTDITAYRGSSEAALTSRRDNYRAAPICLPRKSKGYTALATYSRLLH